MTKFLFAISHFNFYINGVNFSEDFRTVWTYVRKHEYEQFIEQYETGVQRLIDCLREEGWTVTRIGVNRFIIAKENMPWRKAFDFTHRRVWYAEDIFPRQGAICDESFIARDAVNLIHDEPSTFNWVNDDEDMSRRPVFFNPGYKLY